MSIYVITGRDTVPVELEFHPSRVRLSSQRSKTALRDAVKQRYFFDESRRLRVDTLNHFSDPTAKVGMCLPKRPGNPEDRCQEIPGEEVAFRQGLVFEDGNRHRNEHLKPDLLTDHDPEILGHEFVERLRPKFMTPADQERGTRRG